MADVQGVFNLAAAGERLRERRQLTLCITFEITGG